MPIISEEQTNYGFRGAQTTEDPQHPVTYGAGAAATTAAAFRQENTVVNLVQLMGSMGSALRDDVDPNFNPFPLIKGTKYESNHAKAFLGAVSPEDVDTIKARIDQEQTDKEIISAAGAGGIVAGIAAGALDPTLFIPGGNVIKSVKGGYSVSRSALSAAAAGAGAMALTEGVLQANQYTRTAEESGFAIGTGALISGLIGGGAAALLSRGERVAVDKAFEADRASLGVDMAQPSAMGAAAADVRQLKPVGYGFDKIPGINKLVENISPTMRAFSSESLTVRRATADLLETAIRFEDNMQGITTTYGGPAVSRQIQMARAKAELQIGDAMKEAFMRHRFGEESGSYRGAIWDDMRGNTPAEKLSFNDFKKEITTALQNGDAHALPEVQEIAQMVRKEFLDPLKERAVKAGLLSEDVDGPAGDKSWFARVWNRDAIVKRRNEFRENVTNWLGGEQSRKAAAQERLTAHSDELDRIKASTDKINNQLAALERQETILGAKLSERAMEVRRSGAREGALQERNALLKEHVSDLEEFISTIRQEVKDPAFLERVNDLEKEVKALKKEEARSTLKDSDLDKIEREEAEGILSDTVVSHAADIILGKRQHVKEPSFAHWMARKGGVVDVGGDLRQAVGDNKAVPGLLSRKEGATSHSLDAWGERIQSEFNLHYRPDPDEVLRMIEDSIRGNQPEFWLNNLGAKEVQKIEASRAASILDEALNQAGYTPKSRQDVAAFLRGERREGISLADLDKALADMESAGEAIPVSVRAEGVEGELVVAKQEIANLRSTISKAMQRRDSVKARTRKVSLQVDEAGFAARANSSRLGVFQERVSATSTKREMLQEAQRLAKEAEEKIIAQVEEELMNWGGKSASEAVSAVRARNKASVGRAPDAGRLTSADKPMLKAVRRILDSDRNLSPDELGRRADEIIDRILGSPDGRLPYDAPSHGGQSSGFADNVRGSFNSRDFAIPTDLVRDFVENDFDEVMKTINRTLIPDIHIAERFGDVNMTEAFRKINDEYAGLQNAAKTEKERVALRKRQERDIADLAAQRDTLRNMYGKSTDNRMLGRVSSAVKNLTTMTHLGGAALNSIPDLGGVVFRHGFTNVLKDAWSPFFAGMVGASKISASMRKQARAMGIACETELGLRMHQLNDLMETKGSTPWERGAQYGAQYSQVANLLGPWTDTAKTMAFSAASSEALRSMGKVVKGGASTKEIAALAESGIDAQMARRIWDDFNAPGGHNLVDGVMIPNSGAWKDRHAAMTFEAAMGREVDIAVITPGAEKPLWLRGPVGSVLGQFKSFISAANERMLIANLQRADFNTLQGVLFTVAAGMLSYRLYTWATGTEPSDNPSVWIKEGMSRSGIMGWFDEANNMSSKLTRGYGDVFGIIGANEPVSRFQSRSILSTLAGPFSGQVEKAAGLTGSIAAGEWNGSDTHKARQLLPFQNLFYIRRALDQLEEGINGAFGIPNRPPPKP